MVFSAIGMNAPGFASAAPAPMITIMGDDAGRLRLAGAVLDAVLG